MTTRRRTAKEFRGDENVSAAQAAKGFTESYARAFPDVDLQSLEAHLALVTAAQLVVGRLEVYIREFGFDLTRPRYTMLRILYLSEEKTLAQSQIAQLMGVSGPYVTEIIDSLEEAGWAKRIVKRPDRRMTRVRLTPVGRERCGRLVPAVMQYMVDSVASLTPAERDQLTHLASKVHAALSEAQDDMFADAKGIMLGR